MGCGKQSRDSIQETQKIEQNKDTNQKQQYQQQQQQQQYQIHTPQTKEQTITKQPQPQYKKPPPIQNKVQFEVQQSNQKTEKQLENKNNQKIQSEQNDFNKSFADTMMHIERETFIYTEKDDRFKDDFLKNEKQQQNIIIQKKQQEVNDRDIEILESQGNNLTAEIIKENQQANFLISARFKTKIKYYKFSLTLPADSEQILINAIKLILKQFPYLNYQDLIVTQCGKEIPFVKCGGYLYNFKYPSFGIIINFTKADQTNCELQSLESQGLSSIELYNTSKNPKELIFSKLFSLSQQYLKYFNENKNKFKAKSLKELLENESFIQLFEFEKAYKQAYIDFENKCIQGINEILNNKLNTAMQLDQIYSNEFQQYIFDEDIVIIMFKTFYDSDFKQLKKICSVTKLISILPGNDKIFPPQIAIFKQFNNCYFVCYTLLPITRHDQIYGSDEQSLLINSNLDENLSANEMKYLSDYWNSLGNLFNFQELILYEKCSDHKRHCRLPLGTSLYKNQFDDESLPKYFILNFKNFVYPVNNIKSMAEYALLSETNFQLKDGIYYETLKDILPFNKSVQKKQINLIMDDYQKHKEEKQLLKEYFDNELMSLSSSVMTENPAQSANSLQIEINEEGLKQLFNHKKFKLDQQSNLTIIIHLFGMGMKNLGNIFNIAPNQIKSIILVEILARTFKNQIINYQILNEEEIIGIENAIENIKNSISKIVESFLNKEFNEDENQSFLNECQNQFSIKLSFEELLTYQIQAEAIIERIIQLIQQKLEYYSQKIILLRSSAINQLTKIVLSQYLGKQSSNFIEEIQEQKNELSQIIKNDNFI